jgi:hypothetical protein
MIAALVSNTSEGEASFFGASTGKMTFLSYLGKIDAS